MSRGLSRRALKAKSPAASTAPYDVMTVADTIPGDVVFGAVKDGACPLVRP